MNTQAIAQHLNIAETAIIEVQEWAKVLWVKFVGGCRFVSKKINEVKMNIQELTDKAIEKLSVPLFGQCKAWDKVSGETRIYIKKFGYVSVCHKTGKLDLRKVTYYYSTVVELLGNLLEVAAEPEKQPQAEITEEQLIARFGWREAADAKADIAREDWDI